MKPQRLDEMTGPVEVGVDYLVPTVLGVWLGQTKAWPVIGPQHNDAQCLKFDWAHYHLDPRFVARWGAYSEDDRTFWRDVAGSPLQVRPDTGVNADGLPAPVWRRRRCRRLANPFLNYMHGVASQSPRWRCHFERWTGKRARHDGRGWVCPHRSVALSDHAPDAAGVITCPLHLLRIDAATGVVLPPLPDSSEVAA